MNTLSLDSGRPLAMIRNGNLDKEIVHINTDIEKTKKKELDTDQTAILIENLYRNMGNKLNFRKMELLRDAIQNKRRPVNRELAQFYDHAISLMENNEDKELILNEGELVPIFDTKQERSVFMVTGMSGSGKSTYTACLCKTYHQQYPKNKIILFSNKSNDPVFDILSYVDRITITEDLIKDPITLNELENSLVLFDDVECNTSKEIDKELFTSMTTRYSLNYLFGKYFGFSKEVIGKICKLPSRWVQISKCPACVLYKTGAFIPDC